MLSPADIGIKTDTASTRALSLRVIAMTKVLDLFPLILPRRVPKWVTDRYPEAVCELKKVDDGSDRYWRFFWECIASTESARAWKRAKKSGVLDPAESMRKEDALYLKSLGPIINCARRLARHIEKYPRRDAWVIGSALLKLKEEDGCVPLITKSSIKSAVNAFGHGRGTAQEVVAKLLRHMANAYEEMPLAKQGPFEHRYKLGPIQFDKPIDLQSSRADPISTGLPFDLVLRARCISSTPPIRLCSGLRMPDSGRPMYSLAAALVSVASDEPVTDGEVEKRLRKILLGGSKPTWGGWPDPPQEFIDIPNPDSWY